MTKHKWKVGIAGIVATAIITTTGFTGASASAAINDAKSNIVKPSYTSNWQSSLIQHLFSKLVDKDSSHSVITIGNWKFIVSSGFCIFDPNGNKDEGSTPIVTATPNPTTTPVVTATPNPTTTPVVTATPNPTKTPVVTATPNPTTTPVVTATPNPTTTPIVTATPNPTKTPVITATPAPTETPSDNSSSVSAIQQEILSLVNAQRASAGLSALTLDSELNKVAMEKARDMDVNNYFSHTSPTYGSPFDMMKQFGISYSYAGENIASGQTSAKQVMNDWMNSSGHRANILSANFKKLGVGYVNGKWVQMFIG